MAYNKNQHFVPRCHLRPFSLNGEGRAINLFNLDLGRAISNAPLRSQCSADYFYGPDKRLDDAIKFIEESYAGITQKLRRSSGSLTAYHRAVLSLFAFLQHLRTDAAARAAFERFASMCDAPGAPAIVATREAISEAVTMAMLTFAETMRIVDDLNLCIVRNRTKLPFVTSDNPSILTNRFYLQRRETKGRGFGVKNSGTLFILPMAPDLCCLLYDRDIYSIPHQGGWLNICREQDIVALNDHQYLNCATQIYFGDWEGRGEVAAAARDAKERRPIARHSVTHAVLDRETRWGKRYAVKDRAELKTGDEVLIHVALNHASPVAWPSFLRFRSDRKIYSNDSANGFVRAWCLEQGFVGGSGYRRIRL